MVSRHLDEVVQVLVLSPLGAVISPSFGRWRPLALRVVEASPSVCLGLDLVIDHEGLLTQVGSDLLFGSRFHVWCTAPARI